MAEIGVAADEKAQGKPHNKHHPYILTVIPAYLVIRYNFAGAATSNTTTKQLPTV